jgi:hypothetical protein
LGPTLIPLTVPQGVVAISYVDTENRFFEHRIMLAGA